MEFGFVYILINPSYPRHVKIGRTNRDARLRTAELSRQTGVPDDFILLYDELVADSKEVERALHERFGDFRTKANKEFFHVPPREAIKALQEIARDFPVPSLEKADSFDLLPFLREKFPSYLDPQISGLRFLQLPGVCYLEVTRQVGQKRSKVISHDELPLSGIVVSNQVASTARDLNHNVALLRTLEAYDWIMIADIFPEEIAAQIAERFEQPRK